MKRFHSSKTRDNRVWALALLLLLLTGCGQTPAASAKASPSAAPIFTPASSAAPTFTPAPSAAPTASALQEAGPRPKDGFEGAGKVLPPAASPEAEPSAPSAAAFLPREPASFLPLRKFMIHGQQTGQFWNEKTQSYLLFGNFGRGALNFYPQSKEGDIAPDADPVPLSEVTLSPFAPATAPKKDGERVLVVYLGSQSVACFLAEYGEWTLERVMLCSGGAPGHATPLGTHALYARYKYKAMTRMNGILVYAQYATRFRGHYLFHSVPIGGPASRRSQKNGRSMMLIEEYEKLGSPASHGCVRLLVGDAYWIYVHCKNGTRVIVNAGEGPQAAPAPALLYEEPYMNASHTLGWDPTDPDPANPYREIYPQWFE